MTSSVDGQGKSEGNDGDAIKVFVRIRPPDSYDFDVTNQMCISVDDSKRAVIVQTKPEPKVFTYDHVADIHSCQDNIFSLTGKKIIESCVNGYNGTIFAYGQTGSGKTFTMVGPSEEGDNFQHELRGVIPRSFEYLFNRVHREQELHGKGKEFLLKCSFLEIYHEQIFDLLEPSAMSLHLRENMKKGVFVDGLAEVSVTSALEAYNVLNSGWINRRVASTSMNRESSRSHAVFTIQIESKEKKGAGVQNLKESQLNLVDLAGSERQKDTNAVGKRLKEAGSINKSLSILGNVIMSLVDIAHGKNRHIPYRDSKLTFLLRDSLGGNAKTQIIACIHPGSKSFGETLSTLQFARRAKMIKNKAVVNEDTQGNVLSLQLELKRLKEVLSQFQSGEIPRNPSGEGNIPAQSGLSESEWKEKFINAMLFREKANFDKKALEDKLENLEELCKKKEKFLQSTKMIIKFRENNISRLEKAIKNNGITDNQVLETISDLKAEINILKEQVAHHPQVSKYSMEIQHLKSELNNLRGHGNNLKSSTSEVDNRKLEQIERAYKELLAEKLKETDKNGTCTPSHTPKTGNDIATATIEKFKSQINKHKEEIEQLKQDLKEQKEKAEKKELELNSELESYKKANAELNTVLEAHQIKSKIEKEAMNDRHLQTVKTITTPRKAKYTLRSRVVSVPLSDTNSPAPDDSILFEEGTDLISEETQPEFLAEQAHEALMDEVKQLQEQNSNLSQRLEEYEADMIRLRQHISKVDHQNGVLNEMLEKERSNWGSFTEKSNVELTSMTQKLEETKLNAKMLEDERNDLKILLSSADKELKNIKDKNQSLDEEHQKAIGMLETKMIQVDLELSKLSKEYETVSEERDGFMQSLETAQDTLSFNETMLKEMEDLVQTLKQEKNDVEKQLQGLKTVLSQEEEKNKDLMSKMDAAGEAQEKMIYNLMEEKNKINQDLSAERMRQEELKEGVCKLKGQLETCHSTIASQEKQLEENKDAISSFMTRIQELKSELSVGTDLVENQAEYIQDLEKEIQKKSSEIETLQKNVSDMEFQHERQHNSHLMEVSMLKDDLEDAVNNLECYRLESNRNEEEMKELKNTYNQIVAQVKSKEEEKEQLLSEIQALKTLHGVEVSQLQEQLKMKEPAETESRELTRELENKQEEINLLRSNQQSLNRKMEEYEEIRRQKNQEIQNLKDELEAQEKLSTSIKEWEAKFELLKFESENEKKLHSERFQDVQQQLDTCTGDLETTRNEVEQYKNINIKIEAKLTESENEKFKYEEMQTELDRLQEVIRRHHNEKEQFVEEQQYTRTEIERLKESEKKLLEENAKLIGHQNLKQKIHHTQQLKEELVLYREQVSHLQKENNQFHSLLKLHDLLPTPKKSVLKENNVMSKDDPKAALNHSLTTKSTTKKQRFFYSGDYT